MVEGFQSEREVGLALGRLQAGLDRVRDQLVLIRWVMAGAAAVTMAIFAYFYVTTTQITVTVARIDERLDRRSEVVDAHFKAVDQRFDILQKTMDQRFEAMQRTMDQRFDAMQRNMDQRFEAVDQRFDAVDKRLETLTTLLSGLLPPKQKTEGFTLAPRLKNAL